MSSLFVDFAPLHVRTKTLRTQVRTIRSSYHVNPYPMKYGKRKYGRRNSRFKYKRRRIVRRSSIVRRRKYHRRFRRRYRRPSINKVFKEVLITQRDTYNYNLYGNGCLVYHNFALANTGGPVLCKLWCRVLHQVQ